MENNKSKNKQRKIFVIKMDSNLIISLVYYYFILLINRENFRIYQNLCFYIFFRTKLINLNNL